MKKRFVYILLGIVIVLNIGIWGIYIQSQSFPAKAQSKAQAVAEKQYSLDQLEKFYMFNRSQTTYTILGKKTDGTEIYVVYQPETKASQEIPAKQVISEDQALAIASYDLPNATVREATLGMDGEQLSWEVSFKDKDGQIGYHYLNATDGMWYETVNDL